MDAYASQMELKVSRRLRPGFSITELLVVIGIIVLLAGLLIVAMGRVRESSLRTSTLATMQNFGRACDAFQTEHGFYPGVIPEQVLAWSIANDQIGNTFSSTENALLHLMGGYRVCPPGTPGCGDTSGSSPMGQDYEDFDPANVIEIRLGQPGNRWYLKIDRNAIGEGPIINGKPYAPYYTPGPNEVRAVRGQVEGDSVDPRLPDLVDAWGNPILYTRRIRSSGNLVWEPEPDDDGILMQFVIEGWMPYLESESLGELGLNQRDRSMLALTSDSASNTGQNRYSVAAQIIRHPSLGSWNESPLHADNRGRVAPRGEYVLISAGPDGVFFDFNDGPGADSGQPPDIVEGVLSNPQVIESYDDIVIFGGG